MRDTRRNSLTPVFLRALCGKSVSCLPSPLFSQFGHLSGDFRDPLNTTRFKFYKIFKKHFGQSPNPVRHGRRYNKTFWTSSTRPAFAGDTCSVLSVLSCPPPPAARPWTATDYTDEHGRLRQVIAFLSRIRGTRKRGKTCHPASRMLALLFLFSQTLDPAVAGPASWTEL